MVFKLQAFTIFYFMDWWNLFDLLYALAANHVNNMILIFRPPKNTSKFTCSVIVVGVADIYITSASGLSSMRAFRLFRFAFLFCSLVFVQRPSAKSVSQRNSVSHTDWRRRGTRCGASCSSSFAQHSLSLTSYDCSAH